MRRSIILGGVAALAAGVIGGAIGVGVSAGAGAAAAPAPKAVTVVHRDAISLADATRLATVARQTCEQKGFPVSVAVVDTDGIEIVVQRANQATGATVAVARGKARASAGFQSPTSGLQSAAAANPGLIAVPDFVILPGGEPIRSGATLLGGVGVSGAPSGDIDDSCAMAALHAVGL